jgi:hypothetical protein
MRREYGGWGDTRRRSWDLLCNTPVRPLRHVLADSE